MSCDCNKADDSLCLDAGTVVGLVITSFVLGIIVTFVIVGIIWKKSKNQPFKDTTIKLDSSLIRTATYKKRLASSDYTDHATIITEKVCKQQRDYPSSMTDSKLTESEQVCKKQEDFPSCKIDPKKTAHGPRDITDFVYSCASEVNEQSDKLRESEQFCKKIQDCPSLVISQNKTARESRDITDSIYSCASEVKEQSDKLRESEQVCKRLQDCPSLVIGQNKTACESRDITDSIYSCASKVSEQSEINKIKTESIYCNTPTTESIYTNDIVSAFTEPQKDYNQFDSEDVYYSNEKKSFHPGTICTNDETPSLIPEHNTEAVYIIEETGQENDEAIYINQDESNSPSKRNTNGVVVHTTEKKLIRQDSNIYNHLGDSLEKESTFSLYDHAIIADQKRKTKEMHEKHKKQRGKPNSYGDANIDFYDHAITKNHTQQQRELYTEVATEETNFERKNCDGNSNHESRTFGAVKLHQNEDEHEYFILEPSGKCKDNPPNRTVSAEPIYFELEKT